MIPKTIHYCWLSNDPLPENLRKCVLSWKKYLPDYKIVKWDLKRFPLEKNIWVKQAFEQKKYAFAADYIRLYALATEGGIYLDSDVEVVKSFNDLLHLPYFVSEENSPQGIEAATLGAEANTPWVVKCLEYYNDKTFIDGNNRQSTTVLPAILNGQIQEFFTPNYIDNPSQFNDNSTLVNILPLDYFSPKNYITKKIRLTKNTYSIHHFAGTWQPLWKKIALRFWLPLADKLPNLSKTLKNFLVPNNS